MPLIGTAGHVDHGKSTLIRRITGRDPDRWAEEKRRGLTIDLGFGWTSLPDGTEVSFVDVPGHERFLKNMLAGIEAIDVALFVVGADEGWMPQSEEHLAVLDLLGVNLGVIALTKSDLVDHDLLQLAASEVGDRLKGTSLERAPVIPVSGTTGEGVSRLIEALQDAVARSEVEDVGRPRMWVDRSFSIAGAGTVVTGTLLDGSITVDDLVRVYPSGATARIRGVQSHEQSLDRADPGRRVALNLGGIDRGEIDRGYLVGLPGQWELTSRLLTTIRRARYVSEMSTKGAYHIHIGSTALPAKLVGLTEDAAVLNTAGNVPVAASDRFIIRDTGRKLVVAGGRVLDPAPGKTADALTDSDAMRRESSRDGLATVLLSIRGSDTASRLAAHTRGGVALRGTEVAGIVYSPQRLEDLGATVVELVTAEHALHPLRTGLPIATLAERLGVIQEVAELIVDQEPSLTRLGPDIAREGRRIEVGPHAEEEWRRVRAALQAGLAVPTIGELDADPELLHLKIRTGELIRIGSDLVILPEQAEEVRRVLGGMSGEFTVAGFRDAIGLSRKYAVPLLEWADGEGLTVRRGDSRTLR